MYIDGEKYGGEDGVCIGHAGLTVNIYYCNEYLNNDSLSDSSKVVGTSAITSTAHSISFSRSNGSITSSLPADTAYIVYQVSNGRRVVNVIVDKFTGRVSTEKVG